MLEPEQIKKNWDIHLKLIDTFITDRKEKVLDLVNSLEDTLILAPASTKTWYHNAFPGGYIDHVNRVVRIALSQLSFWRENGATIDFTEEELVFAALFHDLGKIGDGETPNYSVQEDTWRRDNLQEAYTVNPELDFMLVPDRSIFILQRNGITLSTKEYLAIKLHDGMYEEGNKPYFTSYSPHSKLKSNIVHILHTADFIASKVEYDKWKEQTGGVPVKSTKKSTVKRNPSLKSVPPSKGLTNILNSI